MRQSISRQAVFALAALWGVVLTMSCPAARGDDAPRRNLVLQAAAPPAAQSQRLALVIGNSTYKDAPLSNPVNDAMAMANALRTAGFTVLLHTDVDHRAMLGAVREFGNRLRQGGVGVFYFAGHGMQIKGRNYLIPVGADIQREDELAYAALDAQAVLDKMEAAGNGTNLMILDACRNNPFARSFRSSTQGLAQMEAPVGTLVAFATAPGSVASDGQSANGLYTQHLLSAMLQPGAKVEDVFKQVRAAVRRDSQGKQIPWEATSLEGDLYFIAPPPKPTVDASLALDDAMWDGVKGSGDPSDLRAYLRRFPTGRHVAAASQQLSTLAAAAAPATAPASPTPAPPAAQPQSQALASAMTLPLGRRDTDARDRLTAELLSELASAPTSATNSTTLPQGGRDTDARDRRTAELLTGLASASTSAVNLPTSASKPSTVPARNAQGFTVGDRWNY
ncbi:MAG: caspase family protein [Burkholderiaceae bacterium]|nr:caspase family protein [Burkholderiaceae bacterium]